MYWSALKVMSSVQNQSSGQAVCLQSGHKSNLGEIMETFA